MFKIYQVAVSYTKFTYAKGCKRVEHLLVFHKTIVGLGIPNAFSNSDEFLLSLYAFTIKYLALVHNSFPCWPMWCKFSYKQYSRRQKSLERKYFMSIYRKLNAICEHVPYNDVPWYILTDLTHGFFSLYSGHTTKQCFQMNFNTWSKTEHKNVFDSNV